MLGNKSDLNHLAAVDLESQKAMEEELGLKKTQCFVGSAKTGD